MSRAQLRADLAAANADAAEHTAVRVRLRDDIDLLEAEARDLQAKLFEAGAQLVAADQQIAERDAILAERAEALRVALEWGAGRDDDWHRISMLRSELTAERECNTKLATLVLRHVERAELPLLEQLDPPFQLPRLEEDALGPRRHQLTVGRQRGAFAVPVDQPHVQILLEGLDAAAQRRLGEEKGLGGLAEGVMLGQGDEVAQLVEVHVLPLVIEYKKTSHWTHL